MDWDEFKAELGLSVPEDTRGSRLLEGIQDDKRHL